MTLHLHRIVETLPPEFDSLLAEGAGDGFAFIARMKTAWESGANRFEGVGEGLFAAWIDEAACGLAGIGRDPYVDDPRIGRLRHVFVAARFRRRGVAERLVHACLDRGGGHFAAVRLRTDNPAAARLYERLGFAPLPDDETATHVLRMG